MDNKDDEGMSPQRFNDCQFQFQEKENFKIWTIDLKVTPVEKEQLKEKIKKSGTFVLVYLFQKPDKYHTVYVRELYEMKQKYFAACFNSHGGVVQPIVPLGIQKSLYYEILKLVLL